MHVITTFQNNGVKQKMQKFSRWTDDSARWRSKSSLVLVPLTKIVTIHRAEGLCENLRAQRRGRNTCLEDKLRKLIQRVSGVTSLWWCPLPQASTADTKRPLGLWCPHWRKESPRQTSNSPSIPGQSLGGPLCLASQGILEELAGLDDLGSDIWNKERKEGSQWPAHAVHDSIATCDLVQPESLTGSSAYPWSQNGSPIWSGNTVSSSVQLGSPASGTAQPQNLASSPTQLWSTGFSHTNQKEQPVNLPKHGAQLVNPQGSCRAQPEALTNRMV